MRLQTLLERVPVVAIRGDANAEIIDVTDDSRRARPGALFIAVPGLTVDGARFIDAAVEKGATAIVSELGEEDRPGVTWVSVADARRALALIAANFYGRSAEKLELVGVTGTSGKTTTTKMVESILDATGEPAGLIGTIEYRAGENREIADRTTPDAIVLQKWFGMMVESGVRRAVMEVSSHALALGRTYGIPYAAAVFTNITREHFDFHGNFENYFAAKKILFDQIDRSRKSAVVNRDDEWGRKLIEELGDAAVTFGNGSDADIHPDQGFVVSVEGLHGDLITPAGRVVIDSPLLGMPNLYNWMGAIGAALAIGIERSRIEEGVRNLAAVKGRFERISVEGGPTVLVDYAHKPDALEKLLHAVRDLAGKRRIVVVFGCGGDRDRGKRPVMGEIAGRLADYTIITSDNPRSEDPQKIVEEIERGIVGTGRPYETILDRRKAIEAAVHVADERTVVVVAGKGHENYQVIGDRIVHFDDREEVEAVLAKRAQKGS
ncbi:MAG: UDP-N-acetylmuramoyl-L-alanyl-D-glutamate--2,6-diaminopimelate ligase [Thermoanaerobaculia bacterium]